MVLVAQSEQSSMDYVALLKTIEQTHKTAQEQAIQAINVALTLRN